MLFSGIAIGLHPGTEKRYWISTTVDAFHIADTADYFIMENCDVSFQGGNNCLNVHDNIGVVESVSKTNKNPTAMKGNLRCNEAQLTGWNPDKAQITVKNNVLK